MARIKKHPGYTAAIGEDLDIIGAEQTVDLNAMKPVLKLTLQAGRPNVGWKKQTMSALELHVDRGSGTFAFLALDTVPDYLDTVGKWSDVASLSVMG